MIIVQSTLSTEKTRCMRASIFTWHSGWIVTSAKVIKLRIVCFATDEDDRLHRRWQSRQIRGWQYDGVMTEGDRERRRWEGEEDVDGFIVEVVEWGGGCRLCAGEAFNPQKHPDSSCSVQMGTKWCSNTHTYRHTHAHTLCQREGEKKQQWMLETFPNTLEDHAKGVWLWSIISLLS